MKCPWPLFLVLSSCLVSTLGQARWASPDEAGSTLVYKQETTIEADGKSKTRIEHSLTIKLDRNRTTNGTMSHRYNSGLTRVTSFKAETINGAEHEAVDKEQIEDKAEKGKDLGFDKTNNLSAAFPHVNVGSVLRYELTTENFIVPVPGQYSQILNFGGDSVLMPPTSYRYVSKIPLHVVTDDPEHFLSIKQHSEGGMDVIEIELQRPLYFDVVNEKFGEWFKKPPYPRVSISSSQEWNDIGRSLSPAYEAELTKTLPSKFAAIADKAQRSSTNFIDRSNSLTSNLADLVRYYGDWRTIKGSYTPRSLQTIEDASSGDCKEFSLITAAAFRKMGYKANIALINRGQLIPPEYPLPTLYAFNHAIVRVEDQSGKVHWIDPTNTTSRAQAIRLDIAGRGALVLDGDRSRLERTPAVTPEDAHTFRDRSFEFAPERSEVSGKVLFQFKGSDAERRTAWELSSSNRQIVETLVQDVANDNLVISSEVEPFDLHSRTVKDIDFKLRYRAKYNLDETSAGKAYIVEPDFEDLAKLDTRQRVSGFYLYKPGSIETLDTLENSVLIGKTVAPCSFQSKWIDGERAIDAQKGRITIKRKLRIKDYGIPAEDYPTAEFKELQHQLQTCLGRYSVIFRKK